MVAGTQNSSKAPWETYNATFEETLDPKLEQEIAEYSQKRHVKTSNQTLDELARQKEINNKIAEEYQWVTPSEYADEGPRIGRVIHSSDFITTLRNKCKVRCWYRQHPQPRKLTLMVQRNYSDPEIGCWIQQGFEPEYTIMAFDEHGVPLAEKYRGWRTCTLQLILKGLLTEDLVNKYFGYASGPVADRYLSTLYGFRNRRFEVV